MLLYQKDGSGPLKRMYLDRIMAPENLKQMQILPIKDVPNLICTYCDRLIAVSSIYKKENRKAFALFAYTVVKKRTKGVFPPKVKNVST